MFEDLSEGAIGARRFPQTTSLFSFLPYTSNPEQVERQTNQLLRELLRKQHDEGNSQFVLCAAVPPISSGSLALTKIDPPSAHKVDPPTVGAHSN